MAAKWTINNTNLETWFERDRAHVALYDKSKDQLSCRAIVQWWDEDVTQAVEDGFLDPKRWHESAVEYANDLNA